MTPKTTEEVATILGIEYATLRKRLSDNPDLRPAKKFGRSWVWIEEEIERVKEKQ